MKNNLLLFVGVIVITVLTSCTNEKKQSMRESTKASTVSSDSCTASNSSGDISCKLTSPEFQARKTTIIADLKKQVLEKKELQNGYAFKFTGTDTVVDVLAEFIKAERECCNFFTFNLSVSGDKSQAWLELVGPEGTKEFIISELEL